MRFFKACFTLLSLVLGLVVAMPVSQDSEVHKPKTLIDYGVVNSVAEPEPDT
ncbi:hypothetical protein F5Y12DRAFT_715463 [Xylaria sp. FL1777]|nr:hypothetical protein F5Y12DRAFT_715463 [Xylaria sp. FL1777]